MKPTTTLLATLISFASVHAEEFVYLKPISGGSSSPRRYEVVPNRVYFHGDGVLRVPVGDIDGYEKGRGLTKSGFTCYVTSASRGSLPARFQFHTLPPGVSYMQSIGGAVGQERAAASVPETPPPTSTPTPTPRPAGSGYIFRPGSTLSRSKAQAVRPFGWPAYRNPLERRPYR